MALFASGNKCRKNHLHMSYKDRASRSLTLPRSSLSSLRQNKQTKKGLHTCWLQWKRTFQSRLCVFGLYNHAVPWQQNGSLLFQVWTLGQSLVQVNPKGREPRTHIGESTAIAKREGSRALTISGPNHCRLSFPKLQSSSEEVEITLCTSCQ